MNLGVDIGGTFTDFVVLDEGRLAIYKVLSTPDPAQGFLQGLRELAIPPGYSVVHGSTVATNAILERKGVRTALFATKGFGDVIEIGRQTRPSLYDFSAQRPPPFVPAELRFEVDERVDYHGHVLSPARAEQIDELVERLRAADAEAVAVSLLFSFVNPVHERLVAERIAASGLNVPVSLSHLVLPEYREYERTSTVVINAYVAPLIDRYLANLEIGLGDTPLRIMQSSGGSISAQVARRESVRTALSGPAGGVVGAFYVAQTAGFSHVITFDMGGTSTDVSLCPGHVQETSEASIGGAPIRVPVIDIHTVGAGGGSIGRVDAAGALAVGPESAGANPGPVCYGRGEELTVTDANLLLGRLQPDYFLGGRMRLDLERSRERMDRLAAELGREPAGAAWGIVRVANSNMENAIRVISVQRGYDPRDFTLVAFGGAGPLHACELAQELRIPRVLVPLYPGVLSALGMLVADVVKDYARTVMLPSASATAERLDEVFGPLEERGWADLRAERFPDERIRPQRFADIRYVGQSFELRVSLDDDSGEGFESRFHTMHQQRFGHADSRLPTEIVTVRLKVLGLVEPPRFEAASLEGADASAARIDERPVYFDAGYRPTWLYDRERLRPGNEITGPAIVVQTDTTSVIPPGWDASVDAFRNLIVDFRKGS